MSHPILLFLTVDAVALLLLGVFAAAVPPASAGFMVTGLCGLGVLLCLPTLLMRLEPAALDVSIGPPGLSFHFALDPLSACFLFITLFASTAVAAVQSTTTPKPPVASIRTTAFCLAGTIFLLLAADGVALSIGVAVAGASIWLTQDRRRNQMALLIPLLLLGAICLLTPAGFAPRFDTIRAAPVDPDHATGAAAMTLAAAIGLVWIRPRQRCWTRDALVAGVVIPSACYLLLRLVADLSGPAAQLLWGFALLLAGAVTAVVQSWRSAVHPEIDISAACLTQRQSGLAMIGVGLALVARTADLPSAASFAFAATLLTAIGGSVAGCLTSLAVHAIGKRAGTYRLSRLGGLIDRMPSASAAMAVGLLGLAAVPPGFGFACLWLLFQSILSAPRASGLLFQLPLALVAAAIALSAALATAASVRLVGIAVLGRPRTPQGAGAQEDKSPARLVLLIMICVSLATGAIPGAILWVLADPAIEALAGAPSGGRIGLALLSSAVASPGYLALPVLALLALATGAVMLIPRRPGKETRPAGLWADGLEPPSGLPFGDPAAQSAGAGFVPPLPDIRLPWMRGQANDYRITLPWFGVLWLRGRFTSEVGSTSDDRALASPPFQRPTAVMGLWLLLVAFGALFLVLSVAG